ncbi:MAG TPA: response regulator [Tepidisphaeraceae bacterium]|jgi:two-component system phosphate regulon response regulator PhoB
MAARTLIIADDEPHLVHIVAYSLKKAGIHVEVASNGLECFELACKLGPDLIVSDYQMPVLDGLQSCIRLKNDPRTSHIPVIMLTARGHRLSAEELARTNIQGVLPKPFSARQLLAKMEEVLAKRVAGGIAA